MDEIKDINEIFNKLRENNIKNVVKTRETVELYTKYAVYYIYYKKNKLVLKIKNIIYSEEFINLYEILNLLLNFDKIKLDFDIMNDKNDLTNIINTTNFNVKKINIFIYCGIDDDELDLINCSCLLKKISIISNKMIKIINNVNHIHIDNILLSIRKI